MILIGPILKIALNFDTLKGKLKSKYRFLALLFLLGFFKMFLYVSNCIIGTGRGLLPIKQFVLMSYSFKPFSASR